MPNALDTRHIAIDALKNLVSPAGLLKERVPTKNLFFLFLKIYVVGTQKNRLNETILLGTQNIC